MKRETEFQAADYRDTGILDYAGNPFIEALPPVLSKKDVVKTLFRRPPFDPAERELAPHLRLQMIERVRDVVVVQPIFHEVAARMDALMRQGYRPRNPLDPAAVRLHYQVHVSKPSPLRPGTSPRASSEYLVVGPSGVGKSTLIEVLLGRYPPAIRHSRYKGTGLSCVQIPWVKMDCSYSGSITALCRDFFAQVDARLGTNFADQYDDPRLSVDHLTRGMQQIAATYGLGLLVIDELQCLSLQKAGGHKKMMNFFLNLRSQIGVPLLFIGTYGALKLFKSEVRYGRRASSRGMSEYVVPTSWKDPRWNLLLKTAFEYQWVKRPADLTDGLKELFWDRSQGITDIFWMLYIGAQEYAIQSGKEVIDSQMIDHVYKTGLRLMHPALNALRSKEPENIARFEDLFAKVKLDLGGIVGSTGGSPVVQLAEKLLDTGSIEHAQRASRPGRKTRRARRADAKKKPPTGGKDRQLDSSEDGSDVLDPVDLAMREKGRAGGGGRK